MNKKIIIIAGVVIVLFISGGVLFSKKGESSKQSKQSAETIIEKAEKAVGETGSIVVPPDIKKVTDELRQKYENQICEKEEKAYCEYYTRLVKKTGEKRFTIFSGTAFVLW